MTNQRQAGKRWERWFANKLKLVFPDIRRNAGEQAQQGGVDLLGTGCFDFEIKGGKAYRSKMVRGLLDQVENEGTKHNYKVVMVKPLREEPYVLMPFTDFMEVLYAMKAEGII